MPFLGPITHDTSRTSYHASNVEEFAQDVNASIQTIYPVSSTGSFYAEVHVLLCCWEDDTLGCITEVRELEDVFDRLFHFEVEPIFKIPSEDSHNKTQERVTEFKKLYSRKTDLLILYYGGHAGITPACECVWYWCGYRHEGCL